MSIPSQSQLGLPVLELLATGKIYHTDQLENKLQKKFRLTTEEQELQKSSGNERLFRNRIRWALFYLKKAGLI